MTDVLFTARLNPASTSDIIGATNIDFWGDSLTLGSGGVSFPSRFATLSGYNIVNDGIGGQTSAQIKTRFDAATSRYPFAHVFWVGKNDVLQSLSMTTLKSNIAAMVAALGHTRYVVIGITPSKTDTTGNAFASTITTLNSDLTTIYGTRFIDIATYLRTQGDGSGNDNADIASGILPRSLQSDSIHLNTAGYALVASQVYAKLSVLQTSITGKTIISDVLAAANVQGKLMNSLAIGGEYQIGGQRVLFLPNQANNLQCLYVGDGGQFITTATACIGIGMNALYSSTSGNQNVGVGVATLYSNLIGTNNTAIGHAVLFSNTATNNTGVGSVALNANSTGGSNTAIGANALSANQGGSNNAAVGQAALLGNISGSTNTGIGYHALLAVTASDNVGLGASAGSNISSGARNIIIGSGIDAPSATTSNQISIGNLFFGTGASGTGTTAAGQAGVLTNAPNSVLHVNGSFAAGYVAKTGTYTATVADYTINCTSGTFTVTLPTAVGCAGRIYVVTNSGAGTITIGTTSSQTFVNFTATPTTLTMATLGSRTVQSNGANWLLLSSL